MGFVTVAELALWQRGGMAFELLDVRRAQARLADGSEIPGARWHDPAAWLDWKDGVAGQIPVLLVCAHGREISQGLAAALCAMGRDARWLHGGIAAWQAAGQPVQPLAPRDAA